MPYRIAGVDVHKKMLAVVIADVEVDGAYEFVRRRVADQGAARVPTRSRASLPMAPASRSTSAIRKTTSGSGIWRARP
jgi:hypothetical protein